MRAQQTRTRCNTPYSGDTVDAQNSGQSGVRQAVRDDNRTTFTEFEPARAKQARVELKPVLIRTDPWGYGQVVQLTDGELSIGRSPHADVQVCRDGVSREHARLLVEEGKLFVCDLESRNGTFVNSTRIERSRLRAGDVLRLGSDVTFRLGLIDDEAAAALDQTHRLKRGTPPTLLLNRRYLDRRLSSEVSHAVRNSLPLSVVVFSFNRLSEFRTQRGERSSNALLRQLLRLIGELLPYDDAIAHYEGETFALVLKGADLWEAEQIAERVQELTKHARLQVSPQQRRGLTANTGCASLDCCETQDAEHLLSIASQRLEYAAQISTSVIPEEAGDGSLAAPTQLVQEGAQAVEAQSPQAQVVLSLVYEQQCSIEEVSLVLNLEEDYVRRVLERAVGAVYGRLGIVPGSRQLS